MVNKCGTCGKFSPADGVKCTLCGLIFHRHCANIGSNTRPPTKWHCKNCKNKAAGTNKNITPQSSGSGSTVHDCDEAPNDINLAHEIKLIGARLTDIVQEVSGCREDITRFQQEVVRLNSTIADFNNRLTSVEEKVVSINKRLTEAETKIVAIAGVDVNTAIECRLNDRDQDSFMCDIEITGIEELPSENPEHLVSLVAQKVGVTLDERDIISAERRGKRSNVAGATNPRTRTLVVRLARKALRTQLIRAARSRRGADTSGILTSSIPRRFYINERLTWYNRRLFHRAREEARSRGWRYVWTRDGRVYARQDTDSLPFRIRIDSDIERVFSNKQKSVVS